MWLVDITEHWTGEGKLYLCVIKDCGPEGKVTLKAERRVGLVLIVAGAITFWGLVYAIAA